MTTSSIETLSYGMRRRVESPFVETVEATREALRSQGFGVLTEIDVQATLSEKLGVDMPAYIILGACNPPLAHRALSADPEVGLLLPCNVVVREADGVTVIDVMDPQAAMGIVQNEDVRAVAEEAKQKLRAALEGIAT